MDVSRIMSLAEIARGDFEPFRPGIGIRPLYGSPAGGGSAAALLKYEAGAKVPAHEHPGHELVYVISGSQTDERGTHRAGTLVLNPPGSRHAVESVDGCLVLVVWEQSVRFLNGV
jgi:anti-sigma factor ChrR (cupin superfamily)